MFFVLDEAVIRRRVGGTEVMREQLARLLEWQRRPHITLRILPFELGAYPGMRRPFMMLDFLSPSDDELLYLEDVDEDESTLQDSPEKTGFFIDLFLRLEERALAAQDSCRLIEAAIREMR